MVTGIISIKIVASYFFLRNEQIKTDNSGYCEVLKVPPEMNKNFDAAQAIYNIQNNYEGSNPNASNIGPAAYMNYQCTFNPLDKYIEQVEENKRLYQALLKEKDEKIALLERMIEKK